jgi:drug/metabolite transporter (DMT)-like permease
MTSGTIICIAATVVLWGLSWVAMRAVLRLLPPMGIASLRMLLCAGALLLLAAAVRPRLPRGRDLGLLLLAGGVGICLYSTLVFYGQRTVRAGPAAVIIQTAPVWMAVGSWLFLRERIRLRTWLGIAAALAGVAMIARGEGGGAGFALSGDVLLLFAASLAFAAYNLLIRPVAGRIGAFPATAWAAGFATLGFLPWLGDAAGAARAATPLAWGLLVFLALLSTLAAYATWAAVLHRLPAARAAVFLYLVPVVALAGGWLILDEVPATISLAGAGTILAGVATAQTGGDA